MSEALLEQLFDSLTDTLTMVGTASLVALLLGTALGVVLFATTERGLWRQPVSPAAWGRWSMPRARRPSSS